MPKRLIGIFLTAIFMFTIGCTSAVDNPTVDQSYTNNKQIEDGMLKNFSQKESKDEKKLTAAANFAYEEIEEIGDKGTQKVPVEDIENNDDKEISLSTAVPSTKPAAIPSAKPTKKPAAPTAKPTSKPSNKATEKPTASSSSNKTAPPTSTPVTKIRVGSNFPKNIDPDDKSSYKSDAVVKYFTDKYKGIALFDIKIDTKEYVEDGYLCENINILYDCSNSNGTTIALEYYEDVRILEEVKPEEPQPADTLDGEYSRIVKSNTIQSDIEDEIINLINESRKKLGVPSLKVNSQLTKIARIKSTDMALNNYFSHTSPTYGDNRAFAKKYNVKNFGENIQYRYGESSYSAQVIHDAFMDSPGHRDNRMQDRYTDVGIGVILLGSKIYITETFR
ncbi:MAG: CAP domain-containing protein [Clostridia bacterium]|nr:CAP domain-containing protein [Clostridia bacterium]